MRTAYFGVCAGLCLGVVTFGLTLGSDVEGRALDHLLETNDIGENKIPNQGTSHILVVPLRIGATPWPTGQLEELETYFATDGGPGTFRQYWLDVSGGRYDPIPTLTDPVVYPDSCPIPGRTVGTCGITFNDLDLLGGGLQATFLDVLGRVRDEQNIDFLDFDVNGIDGMPDGFFDGVISVSNIAEGVMLPLAPLMEDVVVPNEPGGTGPGVTLSLIAAAPPHNHEFAHEFGFIDLYGGPTVNGLMGEAVTSTLSAFSRQQVGWADITDITESVEIKLRNVIDSSMVLRVGEKPRYVLIENRSGPLHYDYEEGAPGIYIYSVDEETLSMGPLHFIDIATSALNLPNESPPYMNVAMPVSCVNSFADQPGACAMTAIGSERQLIHSDGTDTGFTLRIVGVDEEGTFTIHVFDASGPPVTEEPLVEDDEGCGCSTVGRGSSQPWAAVLLLGLAGAALRRRHR